MPAIDFRFNYSMQHWQSPSDAVVKCKWDKLHLDAHKKLIASAVCICLLCARRTTSPDKKIKLGPRIKGSNSSDRSGLKLRRRLTLRTPHLDTFRIDMFGNNLWQVASDAAAWKPPIRLFVILTCLRLRGKEVLHALWLLTAHSSYYVMLMQT